MGYPAPGLAWLAMAILWLVAALPALAEGAAAPISDDQINARIQKHRTAEVTLTVLGADGKPLADAPVTLRQVRHQFLFGCNAFSINTDDATDVQRAYQDRFAALLNYATLPFYWGGYEKTPGATEAARLRMMAAWCARTGIPAKGHPLCWHQVAPKWLPGKPLDEVKALQLGRITREVKEFAGLIDRWDVVNEAVVMPTFQRDIHPIAQWCGKIGRLALIQETFAAARAANPKATLILNDFDTSPRYEALIKECLDAGVSIDAIGIQSHQHGGYWGAQRAWHVCERFAKFGKPLHFTETTFISGETKKNIDWHGRYDDWVTTPAGEERQAREVAEFYRVLFSHPAVQAITWWDLSDRGAWLGAPSGLVRKDMSPKPAYEALMKRVKGEWWTPALDTRTDKDGRVRYRAFLGTHSAVTPGGGNTFEVPTPGTLEVTVKLQPHPK